MTSTAVTGSAERWGPLWGARPADWALSEDQQLPTYEEALRRVGLEPAQRVLDIGCGVGAFLRLVADRGARAVRARRLRGADRPRARSACRTPTCASATWRRCPTTTTRSTSSPASTRSSSPTTWSPRCARPAVSPSRGAPVVIQVWGAARAQRPRGDEGDRQAVLPAAPGRRATRARLLQARRARGPRHRGRPRRPRARSTRTWAYEYPDEETLAPRARRSRRDRRPRRPRPRGRGQGRDRRRPRAATAAPTAATGFRTSTTT